MVFAKNFARFYEKKIIVGTSDAWVDESFVQANQRTSVSDFKLKLHK